MKRIIAILVITTVFSFTSMAQEAAKTIPAKTEITDASIAKDISDLTKTITMNESLTRDFTTLLYMRADAINGTKSEEEKKALFERFGRKFIGGLNDNQLEQFKANKELFTRFTQYKSNK